MLIYLKQLRRFSFFESFVRQCNFTTDQTHLRDNGIGVCKPWKVIFYGTDRLSEVTLKALNLNRVTGGNSKVVESLDVVCIKQVSPVRKYAESCSIDIYNWPYEVPENHYDIGIVVSFGHLIPTKSILACKYGMINAHPSILPRWRGAAPIVHSILQGDTETGVTVLQVAPKKFDVGKILMQQTCPIPSKCTTEILTAVLAETAAEMVLNTLKDLPNFLENGYSQSKEGLTYANKISPDMGSIDWVQSTMCDIDRKFRAFKGFVNVYTHWKAMKVILLGFIDYKEVLAANIDSLVTSEVSPGFCYYHKKRKNLFVKCQDGWSGITAVSIPVRGEITSRDFYNGFMSKVKPNECYFDSN